MSPAVRPFSRLRALAAGAAISLTLLGGCATNGDPRDPLEPLNRGIYKFNDGADALLIKPAGEFYSLIVPEWIRTGVSNFFSNINDVIVALNGLLQGKMSQAGSDVTRLAINTTVGVLGLFDFATGWGFEKHEEDFGQTLGYWGLGDGPYIVLPILGPSNLRDTVGWVGDYHAWPITYVNDDGTRNILIGMRVISGRAELLAASSILETAALDPYAFVRDAYLQRRRNLVYDGKPPLDDEDPDPEAKPKPKPEASKSPAPAEPDPAAKDAKPAASDAGAQPR
jgi:phospholipid-binding lipoprotein MlaA